MNDWRAQHRARILTAAGVEDDALIPKARQTLDWLSGWDEPTIAGVEQLLAAARDAERGRG